MEERKGLGVGAILKITLALMVASLFVSVSTFGQIGTLVIEGMTSVQNASDFTVEVDDVKTLSDTAKYVRHRAGNDGCAESNGKSWNTVYQQNQEGGYPGLEGTYLTKKPNCLGTSSTIARGDNIVERGQSAIYEEGQDQEGLYSRVRFEIKKPITLETSEESGDRTWLEKRIVGVSNMSLQENAMTARDCDNINDGGVRERFLGMGDHFVVYFQPEDASQAPYRSDKFMQDFASRLNNRVYCHPDGEAYSWGAITISEFDQHPVISAMRRMENKVVLCPGDRGYVQMNKAKPLNYDESGESVWSGSAANFPYIQITHLGPAEGETCLPAEMEPAATFDQVQNAERIQLPLEADEQIASMIPDKFENTVIDFVEGYWDDYAAQPVEDLQNMATDAADTVLDAAAGALGSAVDAIGDAIGSLLGDDAEETVENALDAENIDPITDLAGEVFEVAEEAIDGTMKDSLHLEMTFTNHHLDMDDDAYFGADFRGGFKINMWESGEGVDDQFETEPAGGLYHEDVPQGQIGAGELDALQSGWDGNGGIENLGCYIKAELLLEQKEDAMDYPERSEQVWTIWIGDLVDQEDGDECDRNGRIDGRAGVAWGGTSTLDEVNLDVVEYHPGENKLEVSATATASSDGDANIDGGMLEIGYQDGSIFEMIDFVDNCEGTSCSIAVNITGVENDGSRTVKARFERNGESVEETSYTDVSEHLSPETVLGPEMWNWDSVYNSTSDEFNVSVKYGDIAADRDQGIDGATMSLENISSGVEEIEQVSCGDTGEYTECIIEKDEISPAADGELDFNATIDKNGVEFWDTETISP